MSMSALRKLTRKLPQDHDLQAAMNAVFGEAEDRTTVIMAASLLELQLRLAISSQLSTNDERLTEAIYTDNGPLSTFSSKILMARAMGIIGEKTATNLDRIRQIRNAFAHSLLDVNLDTPEIARIIAAIDVIPTDSAKPELLPPEPKARLRIMGLSLLHGLMLFALRGLAYSEGKISDKPESLP
jgi:hypothetical protein